MARFAPVGGAKLAATVVLWVEVALLGLLAALFLTLAIVDDAQSRELSFGLAALGALAAAGLAALARGVWKARRWATSPALTWQVLQGFVGAYVIWTGQLWVLGLCALVPAIVGAVALVMVARAITPR